MTLSLLVSSPRIRYSHSLCDDRTLGLEFYTKSLQVALGYDSAICVCTLSGPVMSDSL